MRKNESRLSARVVCRLDSLRLGGNLPAILLLGIVVLVLFAPYLFHPAWLIYPNSGFSSDLVHFFWPNQVAWADALTQGQFHLWYDSAASGQPASVVGDLRMYPFALLAVILPSTAAITVLMAVHVLLGGIFVYYLVRALFSASCTAALVSALSFMLMPKLMAHLAGGHLPNLFGLTWMPAVLLGAWSAMQMRRAWPAFLAGIALTLQLSTHPQILISTLYLLGGLICWHWLRALMRSGWHSRDLRLKTKWIGITLSLVGVTVIGVGAIWWLPFVGLLPWSKPIEFDSSVPFWYQLPPALLLSLFVPSQDQFPEWTVYVGIIPLLLALIALGRERRIHALVLWAMVLVALLIALGDATPVYPLARWLVPGLGLFRTRTRLWFLGGFAFALLAGLGLDALRQQSVWDRVERRQKWYKLGTAFYLLTSILTALALAIASRDLPVEALRAAAVGLVFWLVFWLWKRRPPSWLAGALLMIPMLLLDLLPMASGFMTAIDPQTTVLAPSPSMQFLSGRPGVYRVYSPDWTVPDAVATALDIDLMHGQVHLQLAPAADLINIASGCDLIGYGNSMPPCLTGEIDPLAYRQAVPKPNLLGLLNVRFVVSGFPIMVPGLTPVFQAGAVTVYENSEFLPRAFLVDRVEAVTSREILFKRLVRTDVAQTALIEQSENPPILPSRPVEGAVVIEVKEPGSIWLDVETSRDALMVYSEMWAPGWKAIVNGEPVPVLRVDGALLGLRVPQGHSRVALEYEPLTVQIGWRISLASVAGVALLLAGSCLRARNSRI